MEGAQTTHGRREKEEEETQVGGGGGETIPIMHCTANVGKQEHGYRCIASIAPIASLFLSALTQSVTT